MNNFKAFIYINLKRLFIGRDKIEKQLSDSFCQYTNQEANDYIYETLNKYDRKKGIMMSKLGSIELNQMVSTYFNDNGYTLKDLINYLTGRMPLVEQHVIKGLYNNAGVFPYGLNTARKFARMAIQDCSEIDILGSYLNAERVLSDQLKKSIKVNLNAFYAPFLWRNPWTKFLKGKRVLVIHPFVESIEYQYTNNRTKIFQDPDVLPEFQELICIKAIQSQAGEKTKYLDWFEALQAMKDEISKKDFDVAIIGCGAYGMSLAAHVKRMGKVAIHLGGWVQMLFGVYGKRWLVDQPEFAKFVNNKWIRPNENERIKNASKIEGGAYW